MQTKLTLRMESRLVEQAKAFAKSHGNSLSAIVTDYFRQLGIQGQGSVRVQLPNWTP